MAEPHFKASFYCAGQIAACELRQPARKNPQRAAEGTPTLFSHQLPGLGARLAMLATIEALK